MQIGRSQAVTVEEEIIFIQKGVVSLVEDVKDKRLSDRRSVDRGSLFLVILLCINSSFPYEK